MRLTEAQQARLVASFEHWLPTVDLPEEEVGALPESDLDEVTGRGGCLRIGDSTPLAGCSGQDGNGHPHH